MGQSKPLSPPGTPWARGRLDAFRGRPKLLFGQMYEDAEIEASVFPSGHVFTIASAGDTSLLLAARGLTITAVDINPAQVQYLRDRLAGGPIRMGTGDRLFAFCRSMYPVLGMTRMREFLQLDDPEEQMEFWRHHLDTTRLRVGLRLLINRFALQLVYHRTFLRMLPPRFDRVIRLRMEACFKRHPNRTNPYAWRLLAGIDPPGRREITPVPERIQIVEGDAATYLEHCPPGSFDGFTLSNILDGTDEEYADRLMGAVRHAARPGAPVVLRSFAEPAGNGPGEWQEKDRSLLWGVVRVDRIEV